MSASPSVKLIEFCKEIGQLKQFSLGSGCFRIFSLLAALFLVASFCCCFWELVFVLLMVILCCTLPWHKYQWKAAYKKLKKNKLGICAVELVRQFPLSPPLLYSYLVCMHQRKGNEKILLAMSHIREKSKSNRVGKTILGYTETLSTRKVSSLLKSMNFATAPQSGIWNSFQKELKLLPPVEI